MEQIPGYKFPRKLLNSAFVKVCCRSDWKAPINAIIPWYDLQITREAIQFFYRRRVANGPHRRVPFPSSEHGKKTR